MKEELTLEQSFPRLRQEELISRQCATLPGELAAVWSVREAQTIGEAACRRFDSECDSTVVRRFLKQYADALLRSVCGDNRDGMKTH